MKIEKCKQFNQKGTCHFKNLNFIIKGLAIVSLTKLPDKLLKQRERVFLPHKDLPRKAYSVNKFVNETSQLNCEN